MKTQKYKAKQNKEGSSYLLKPIDWNDYYDKKSYKEWNSSIV